MTAQGPHPTRPTAAEVRDALQDVDFPTTKEDLVACLEAEPSREPVTRQLRALPLATYENVDEVLRSVDLADQLGR